MNGWTMCAGQWTMGKRAFWAKFPPGTYFLGDPGTVLREDLYHDEQLHKRKRHHGTFEHGGQRWAEAHAIRDGWYESEPSGWRFAVDAGLMGVVPEALWKQKAPRKLARLGKVVTAKKALVFRAGKLRRIGIEGEPSRGRHRMMKMPTRRISYRVDDHPAEFVDL